MIVNIRLEDNGAFVEVKKGRVSHWKKVRIIDIVTALNESIGRKANTEPEPSPVLPPNTIGFIKYPEDNQRYELIMYQPACRSTVIYEERIFENVGTPSAVYKFSVRHKQLMATHIWAVSEKIIRPETPLYCFPFYNVSGENGYLCMGSNRIEINEPWELFKIPTAIQAMPSTRAYAFRNTAGLDGDSLFKSLQGKDFPNDWLVPAKKTLNQILKAGY